MDDRNCLSYWFPKIRDAGLPVPRTELVVATEREQKSLFKALDGEQHFTAGVEFIRRLMAAVNLIGCPCFLRTGHTSGKHRWETTCYLASPNDVGEHALALIEYSELSCITGLPCDVWAVRELLPTKPQAVLPNYCNMPLCREFRAFVADGEVEYVQPYWPRGAIEMGFTIDGDGDRKLPDNFDQLVAEVQHCEQVEASQIDELASRAGAAVGWQWSVDILETERGWYVTDMAQAKDSWGYDAERMQ